jgi:hypothetical protein
MTAPGPGAMGKLLDPFCLASTKERTADDQLLFKQAVSFQITSAPREWFVDEFDVEGVSSTLTLNGSKTRLRVNPSTSAGWYDLDTSPNDAPLGTPVRIGQTVRVDVRANVTLARSAQRTQEVVSFEFIMPEKIPSYGGAPVVPILLSPAAFVILGVLGRTKEPYDDGTYGVVFGHFELHANLSCDPLADQTSEEAPSEV